MSRLLSLDEAAEYLSLTKKQLESLRAGGAGPPVVRISARTLRYRREDLDNWIESRIETFRPSWQPALEVDAGGERASF